MIQIVEPDYDVDWFVMFSWNQLSLVLSLNFCIVVHSLVDFEIDYYSLKD